MTLNEFINKLEIDKTKLKEHFERVLYWDATRYASGSCAKNYLDGYTNNVLLKDLACFLIAQFCEDVGFDKFLNTKDKLKFAADCFTIDLKKVFKSKETPKSEMDVQNLYRLYESYSGSQLYRNNVGSVKHRENSGQTRFVRFGLGNENTKASKRFRSSDLIGFDLKGYFKARECKKPNWSISLNKNTELGAREIAQFRFLTKINAYGLATGRFVTYIDKKKEYKNV